MVGLLEQVRLYDEEQAWLRQFVIPEERRRLRRRLDAHDAAKLVFGPD